MMGKSVIIVFYDGQTCHNQLFYDGQTCHNQLFYDRRTLYTTPVIYQVFYAI